MVRDLDVGCEYDATPFGSKAGAQIDVFGVQEELFVESAYPFEKVPSGEKTGSTHPVDVTLCRVAPLDVAAKGTTPLAIARVDELLSKLGRQAHHAPE